MSYQVLARKWRPKSFTEVIGQNPTLQILTNALKQKRLHHAYLFTGPRGVGKTSLGRILAKCLNCEIGVTAEPCCRCDTCLSIDACKFIDLIEVDAASRTKVEDIRDLLNNVQYAPTIGRYKIYLIDEVHMLSLHSFNALLKTLEEPPEHVKFLLATTDRKRLPITILSRCLQFNLQNIALEKIKFHLKKILDSEAIDYEESALWQLAKASEGSMRDALSLLDQAIAYGEKIVKNDHVTAMLGTLGTNKLLLLLKALIEKNSLDTFAIIDQLAKTASDFSYLLNELLTILHHIALLQKIPNLDCLEWEHLEELKKLSTQISAEDIQLYYQIALIGKRDLPLAPNLRDGFEMIMLRMLAFCPLIPEKPNLTENVLVPKKRSTIPKEKTTEENSSESILATHPPLTKQLPNEPKSCDEWLNILKHLKLSGTTKALIRHCMVNKFTNNKLELLIEPSQAPLLNIKHEERLSQACSDFLKRSIQISIGIGKTDIITPTTITKNKEKKIILEKVKDPNIKTFIDTFNAKIIEN